MRGESLVGRVVPRVVCADEAFEDGPQGYLFPEEERVIARAAEKRGREFTTARICARAALSRLGVPPGRSSPAIAGRRAGRTASSAA